MRPGIGRNTSCALGDCLTSRPKGRSRPRELWFSIYSCSMRRMLCTSYVNISVLVGGSVSIQVGGATYKKDNPLPHRLEVWQSVGNHTYMYHKYRTISNKPVGRATFIHIHVPLTFSFFVSTWNVSRFHKQLNCIISCHGVHCVSVPV